MQTLALDARWLHTGLGTYTLNLIRELTARTDIPLHLLTRPEYRRTLSKFTEDIAVVDAPIYSLAEQFKVAHAARHYNVLHVPHYNAPLLYKGFLLVTIHDLTHILDENFRKTVKSWLYAQPMLRLVARRADHIFTVSEYSKRQIVDELGIASGKITVVWNGIGPHIYPEPREIAREKISQALSVAAPYILFVGNLKASKNVSGLLQAFSLLKSRLDLPHHLLVVGDDAAGRPQLMKLAQRLRLDKSLVFVSRLNDDQLRAAYAGADLTVLPSFEEGFGLPLIESMACGTPVACSHAASLPEVAGAAAEFFDPHDADSIASTIENVLVSSSRWRELHRLGLERAQIFTRQACGERHFDVYRKYLGLPDRKMKRASVVPNSRASTSKDDL
jgi:glycosyltransferase involved in cell wall biosynthesis